MLIPIKYKEYHQIYADHLMRDVDVLPNIRIIDVEFYDMQHRYFKSEYYNFNLLELAVLKGPFRQVTIS